MKRTCEVLLVVFVLVGGYPTRVRAQALSMPQTPTSLMPQTTPASLMQQTTPTSLMQQQQRGSMPQTAAAASGLMVAYAMTNGSDSSGNARTLTLENTVTAPGKYAEAQRFNGTSSRGWINVPNPTLNAFTLEAWVNFTPRVTTQRRGPVILGRSLRDSGGGWQAILYKSPDDFFLAETAGFLTMGFTSTTGVYAQTIAPVQYTENTWIFVTATYDGTTLTLYQNGVIQAQAPANGAVRMSNSPVEVGGSATDQGWLNGLIDDVRVYSRALTASEVAADMATPVDVIREDVVSWDIEVFSKDAPSSAGGAPIASANFPRSAALCGQAPLVPPTGAVQNPTTARVSDPAATGKECELMIESLILGVPTGTGYTTTARARGATTVSDRSPASNPFDRVSQVNPPNPPNPSGPPVLK